MSKDMSALSIQKIVSKDPAFPEDFMRVSPVPAQVYISSTNWPDIMSRPRVAIVGSRKVSPYGKHVTELLARDLARTGVVIVSGLAIGIDAIAHRACLEAGGITVAVLPSSIQEIYPARHTQLAQRMLAQGGALLTEYEQGSPTYRSNFVARNRLVASLSHVVLVTEASEKSGTMHTARFALEQGKDVLAVPGSITSRTSRGTHNLIKSGAGLVSDADDVLRVLGISRAPLNKPQSDDPNEQLLIDMLIEQSRDGSELLASSNLPVQLFNQTMTMLEIKGLIRPLGANQWGIM
jgi:DNA processing protein